MELQQDACMMYVEQTHTKLCSHLIMLNQFIKAHHSAKVVSAVCGHS